MFLFKIWKGDIVINNTRSRKWQITINNPLVHGYPHKQIRENLETITHQYGCMCDEIGAEGTPHTHVYVEAKNPIKYETIKKLFYHGHIEPAKGTAQQNRDYIRKEGKYLDSDKKETNLAETFEEWGEMPVERQKPQNQTDAIYKMIKNGATNAEIIDAFPSAITKIPHIDRARQTYLEAKYREQWRNVEVVYIWGKTGVGKTRKVMDEFGYGNVCKITNYKNPFDNYNGEDVILFDEFRSSLLIRDMLQFIDGYPCQLPARYADRWACFTKVFILSNIPLEKQYPNIQTDEPETWEAFKRRINEVIEMKPQNGKPTEPTLKDLGLDDDFEEIPTDENFTF